MKIRNGLIINVGLRCKLQLWNHWHHWGDTKLFRIAYISFMKNIAKGTLLIAEPFLKDIHFQRTVVLLCEHQQTGTFGILINKILNEDISYLIEELEGLGIPLYDGGPVNRNQIHFLHQYPNLIPGGQHVTDGIYWGGDFDIAASFIKKGMIKKEGIRFYLGYSGWGENQLEDEMKEKSWLTLSGYKDLVFHKNAPQIWKKAVSDLGEEFLPMVNYPLDPSFN